MIEPSLTSIRAAQVRIERHVVRTPLLSSTDLNDRTGARLVLKCENLQVGGAFKARGACNAVLSLTESEAARGVCTHSSGNHAAALARAARLRGIPAYIVMPGNSRPGKLQAVRVLGVEPILSGPSPEQRQAALQDVQMETGATLIHPYDDDRVIAGQGTAALELLDQSAEPPHTLLVPVGGGGLLAGTLLAIKSLAPSVEVIGVEPAWADDAFRSWKSGTIQSPSRYDTVADGLRTSLGQRTFPIIQRLVDDLLLCSEQAIRQATDMLLNVGKLVVEPSGAVPLAAVLQYPERFGRGTVALLISGGNMCVSESLEGTSELGESR